MHNPNPQSINMAAFVAAFMTGGYTIAEFEAALAVAGFNPTLIATVINTLRTGGSTIRGAYYLSRVLLVNPYYVASAGMVIGTMAGLYGAYNYYQRQLRRSTENLIEVQVQHNSLNRQVAVLHRNRIELQETAGGLQSEINEIQESQANLLQVRQFEQHRLLENQKNRKNLQAKEADLSNKSSNIKAPHL